MPSCSTPTMTAPVGERPSCPMEVIFEEFPFPSSPIVDLGDKYEELESFDPLLDSPPPLLAIALPQEYKSPQKTSLAPKPTHFRSQPRGIA